MASRTLPGALALKGDWNLGEDSWKDENDLNLLMLSVFAGRQVKSCVSATPGAPVEGDIHIFKSDHPTDANKVAVYDEGAWHLFAPWEGLRLYNVGDATEYRYKVAGGWTAIVESGAGFYNYGSFAVSSIAASEILMDHIVAIAHTLADDFVGCVASVGTNPAATWTADIRKNGASVGSLSISAAGVVTFATTGTTVAMAAGDVLTLVAPASADPSIARVRFTFKGTI